MSKLWLLKTKTIKEKPAIAIIMPVYNAEQYLSECLDSILSQSFTDWELIAVDDFSTDDSLALLRKYATEEPRIKVYQNSSKGITPALQKGYQKANGNFITRMDADDVMTSDKLELLLNAVQGNQHTVAVGKVKYFAAGKKLAEGYRKYAGWLNNMVDDEDHYQHIYKECAFPSPCWMMSRETFGSIGGFNTYAYPEDYDLAFRAYQHKLKVVGVAGKAIHLWRDHENRASRNDANYSDQNFLPLKLHYFFKLDFESKKDLILWGCGRAAKSIAKLLIKRNQDFIWLTDNPKKIGVVIYGQKVESTEILKRVSSAQIITAIKAKGFMEKEKLTFEQLRNRKNAIYHFY